MYASRYLKKLNNKKLAFNSGAKSINLLKLKSMGFNVPVTYVLPYKIHKQYLADADITVSILKKEVNKLPLIKYAVRSSANTEDGSEKSFAGQFSSFLDVFGTDSIIDSVISVWQSVSMPQTNQYSVDNISKPGDIEMAVIIQQMIDPIFSGVAFSRNPLTGIREIIVEAVKGNGISLMQEGLTPFRWVSHSGHFTKYPETTEIPESVIARIVKETKDIAAKAKWDVDLEWVWNGKDIFWVQMRKITSLKGVKLYSNRISKEMLAGLIKPLIWSVNIPLVNSVWINILKELTGPNDIKPYDLAKPFYYRAYFNMGLLEEVFESAGIPAESLEVMWGFAPRENKKMSFKPTFKMIPLIPRMIRFAGKKWQLPKLMDKKLPELEKYFRNIKTKEIYSKSPEDIITELDDLFSHVRDIAYFNITAPLSLMIYSFIFRKQLEKSGNGLESIDMRGDEQKIKRFNPGGYLEKLSKIYKDVPDNLKATLESEILHDEYTTSYENSELEIIKKFKDDFLNFMNDFGHLSDNGNDFSCTTWKEDPEKLLNIIKNFDLDKEPGNKIYSLSIESVLPKRMFKRKFMKLMYKRSRQFSEYRDYVSYLYTFGYGIFRLYFLQLGHIFAERQWISYAEDIFYLEYEEIKNYLDEKSDFSKIKETVLARKIEMENSKDYILPEFIYGDQNPLPEMPYLDKLVGVPTSGGYCTGVVKVIKGMADFEKVNKGDIIVIPHSDISWTLLFKKAAGVIAESGGMLSHSSIVAREYGIPAVVSVFGAMQLKDGILASIDGYKGEISILTGDEAI